MQSPVSVPLLDLKAQYKTIQLEIDAAMKRVVESQTFILGPELESLEAEIAAYSKTSFAIGCASGSDAIMLALLALGIGPGDEVLCPTYTFFATAGYVSRVGARPVFADVDPVTFNLCAKSAREAAKKCTKLKAIMPVHLYGQCADMKPLEELARELNVPLIEDAAQAIGSEDTRGKRACSMGKIGCLSFFPTKNLGAFGDAGMTVTNDPALAERMKMIRVHGSQPKYYHKVVGVNSRLDALQAAVLRVKLKHLDAWTAARQNNARHYDAVFASAGAKPSSVALKEGGLPLRTPQAAPSPARHIYNQYIVRVPADKRGPLQGYLKSQGIGTEIYYPLPLHLQECFTNLGYKAGSFPVAEQAANETLALPIYPELTSMQLNHVAHTVIEFLSR